MLPIVNFSTIENFALIKLAYNLGSEMDLKSTILLMHEQMFQAGVKA